MRRLLIVLAALAIALTALAGCGAGGRRTALAVRGTAWGDGGELVLQFECADLDSVDVEPGAGEAGIPLVTAWGEPTVGRCTTEVAIPVPPAVSQLDDAATGTVVDLPPRP